MDNNDIFVIDDYQFKKKIDAADIRKRVKELALSIEKDYCGKKLTFIIVLKGAFIFASDLIRNINLESEIFFVDSKSYGNSLKSSGDVVLNIRNLNIENKEVIIIEDIVDTGRTLKALTNELRKFNPASVQVAAFLSKPDERIAAIDVKYTGIEIPSDFVVGYGLDFAERGRHLPHLYSKI